MAIQEQMQAAMSALDDAWNGGAKGDAKTVGIVILTFPFGGPKDGRVNYIGNGERDSVRIALKELLARWEGRYAETETSN